MSLQEVSRKSSNAVKFRLEQNGEILPISYVGRDLLPDTFKDGAQALAEGHLTQGGEFEATKIQAKCASKYEATYGKGAKPTS